MIRTARLADATRLAGLITTLGYPTTSDDMRRRLAPVARPDYARFVAEVGRDVTGMAGATITHYYEKNGAYATPRGTSREPAHRGHGLGAALVREIEGSSAVQGAAEVLVNSGNHRTEAHAFYRRQGYQVTGVRFVKSLAVGGLVAPAPIR